MTTDRELNQLLDAAEDACDIHIGVLGEVVSRNDVDALIDTLEQIKALIGEARKDETQLRIILADKTDGETKTRHIRGQRRQAEVVMPADGWDQSKLKEVWNSFSSTPELEKLRDEVLRIGTISVNLAPYKKLCKTTGTKQVELLKSMLQAANQGPKGIPTVKPK